MDIFVAYVLPTQPDSVRYVICKLICWQYFDCMQFYS